MDMAWFVLFRLEEHLDNDSVESCDFRHFQTPPDPSIAYPAEGMQDLFAAEDIDGICRDMGVVYIEGTGFPRT